MPSIHFFRQLRRDGGIRTGVDVEDETVLWRFHPGRHRGDPDPAIEWYVDVRCQGPRLPHDPEGARDWLLKNGRAIHAALEAVAESIPAGVDPSDWPLRHEFRIGAA